MTRPKGAITIPTLGTKKTGPKTKAQLKEVATTIGRPVGLAHKMKELQARLILSGAPERIIDKMLKIAENDEHPKQVEMILMLAKRFIPETDFSGGEEKMPKTISVEISDVSGNVTKVTVGDQKAIKQAADYIDMGDVEEVEDEAKD